MGLSLGSDGYILINIHGKRRRIHRIIYEAYHKCRLLKWTIIHHRNRNPLDNSIDNLEPVIGFGNHLHEIHNRGSKRIPNDRMCVICESGYSKPNKKGTPNWFRYKDGFICDKCYHYEYLKEWRKNRK